MPQEPLQPQPDQQPQLTPTADPSDIRTILDPLQADKGIKASAWDAFHGSNTPQEFQQKFESINLPKETKAALWDAKFSHKGGKVPPGKITEESEHARQLKGGAPTGARIEDILPTAGATVGAVLTAPGGPGTAALGAGAGAVLGESVRGLVKQARGIPSTRKEALESLAAEGIIGAGTELGSRALAYPLKAAGGMFAKTAARGTQVPMLPSEAGVGGPAMKSVEGFLEHAIPSSGTMQGFRAKQLGTATDVIDQEIKRLSSFKGTPEQMGVATQKAIDAGRAAMKEEVNGAYKAIDDMTASQTRRMPETQQVQSKILDESGKPMSYEKQVFRKQEVGGVQPETTEVRKAAIGLLREIKQQEKLMDPKLLADTKSMLESIVRAPKNVPYQTMAKSRSDLLAVGRKLDEALPGKRAGMAKMLAGAMDNSMTQAAERSGISGLPEQVRAANALSREMHRKFEQDLVTKLLDSKRPELISGYVKTAGSQELRDLSAIITPADRNMIRSQVVQDALTGASETGKLEPGKFAKSILDIGDERGYILFGNNWSNVSQIANLMNRIQPRAGGMAAGLHNFAYMRAAPAAGLATAGGIATGHPGTGTLAGAGILAGMGTETYFLRKLAKSITNPAKSAQVLRYMTLAARGTPYAMGGLAHLVAGEEDYATPEQAQQFRKTSESMKPIQNRKDAMEALGR